MYGGFSSTSDGCWFRSLAPPDSDDRIPLPFPSPPSAPHPPALDDRAFIFKVAGLNPWRQEVQKYKPPRQQTSSLRRRNLSPGYLELEPKIVENISQ